MGWEEDRIEQLFNLLPEGWEEKAKELGALRRPRKIKTADELLHMILLYLTEGKSFRGTSALMRLAGETNLSDVAVLKRMRKSAGWLQCLCENIYRQAGLIVEKPQWLNGKDVQVVDSSEDVKCGVRRQCYMLHYSLNLFTLAARELLVTDNRTGEKLANFRQFKKGDIVIGDRIYGTLTGVSYLKRHGADYVLRVRSGGFTMYDGRKRKTDIFQRISGLEEGKYADITVKCIINGCYEPVRICAMRKDKDS